MKKWIAVFIVILFGGAFLFWNSESIIDKKIQLLKNHISSEDLNSLFLLHDLPFNFKSNSYVVENFGDNYLFRDTYLFEEPNKILELQAILGNNNHIDFGYSGELEEIELMGENAYYGYSINVDNTQKVNFIYQYVTFTKENIIYTITYQNTAEEQESYLKEQFLSVIKDNLKKM